MNEQLSWFPEEEPAKTDKTLFDKLFKRVENPVDWCTNCLCRYCTKNVEQPCSRVTPEEVRKVEPCFNCDDCFEFDGKPRKTVRLKENCNDFVLSNYGAKRNRKHLKLINGGKNEADITRQK